MDLPKPATFGSKFAILFEFADDYQKVLSYSTLYKLAWGSQKVIV